MTPPEGLPVTLPCLLCGRELESALGRTAEAGSNQPYAGTRFYSPGQYGSTAWDPQTGGVFLEVNVCDPCLLERHGRVLRVVEYRKTARLPERWQPADPDGEGDTAG